MAARSVDTKQRAYRPLDTCAQDGFWVEEGAYNRRGPAGTGGRVLVGNWQEDRLAPGSALDQVMKKDIMVLHKGDAESVKVSLMKPFAGAKVVPGPDGKLVSMLDGSVVPGRESLVTSEGAADLIGGTAAVAANPKAASLAATQSLTREDFQNPAELRRQFGSGNGAGLVGPRERLLQESLMQSAMEFVSTQKAAFQETVIRDLASELDGNRTAAVSLSPASRRDAADDSLGETGTGSVAEGGRQGTGRPLHKGFQRSTIPLPSVSDAAAASDRSDTTLATSATHKPEEPVTYYTHHRGKANIYHSAGSSFRLNRNFSTPVELFSKTGEKE